MPAGDLDFIGTFKIEAGTTFDHTIQINDKDGNPFPLTDYDPSTDVAHIGARCTMRRSVDDLNAVAPVFSLGAAASDGAEGCWIVQPPTLGQIRLVIDADTSYAASWTSGSPGSPNLLNRSGILQIEVVTDSENEAKRAAEGTFEIDPEATRPD